MYCIHVIKMYLSVIFDIAYLGLSSFLFDPSFCVQLLCTLLLLDYSVSYSYFSNSYKAAVQREDVSHLCFTQEVPRFKLVYLLFPGTEHFTLRHQEWLQNLSPLGIKLDRYIK